MKVLVVNGSPRGAAGNTEVMIQKFLEGAREAGVTTDVVYLKDKKIAHCTGCFACWTKTPGVCVHKDDMPELLLKIRDADVVACATPLYVYTVTGLMKDFMDRLLPLAQPFFEIKNGVCMHPGRYEDSRFRKAVLISNCGFPEQSHFSGLKETFRTWFRGSSRELAGMICCAGGGMLSEPDMRDGLAWYLDAVRQAGREVVEQGSIAVETQLVLDKPLMEDQVLYANTVNAIWRSMGLTPIGETAPEAAPDAVPESATQLAPPTTLETVQDLIAGMAFTFNPKAAGDMHAVLQFVVTDEEPGKYFLEIADGRCIAYAGEHPAPTATITTPSEVWMAIAGGKLNGATAFMTGQYKVAGDLTILMRMNELFPPAAG